MYNILLSSKTDFCNQRTFKCTMQHDNSAQEVNLVALFKPLPQSQYIRLVNLSGETAVSYDIWCRNGVFFKYVVYYLSTLASNTLVLQDMHLPLLRHMNHNKQVWGSPHIISYKYWSSISYTFKMPTKK